MSRDLVTWAGVTTNPATDQRCADCNSDLPPKTVTTNGPRFFCATCSMARAEYDPEVRRALTRIREGAPQ